MHEKKEKERENERETCDREWNQNPKTDKKGKGWGFALLHPSPTTGVWPMASKAQREGLVEGENILVLASCRYYF